MKSKSETSTQSDGGGAPAIQDYLAGHHPFDQLPIDVLAELALDVEQVRYAAGHTVLQHGQENDAFHLVLSGLVDVINHKDTLVARLGEGDMFGHRSLLGNKRAEATFRVAEDTEVVRLRGEQFQDLYRDHVQFKYFFAPLASAGSAGGNESAGLMTVPLTDIVHRAPITVSPSVSIHETAKLMTDQRVSSVMVVDNDKLLGLVTDRDLRNRVLSVGLAPSHPVAEIMTTNPITVSVTGLAYDALLAMARHNIHHLPVTAEGRIVGMITDTDLVQRYSTSPLYFVRDIYSCESVEQLVSASERLPQMLVNLVEANAAANSIGHVISSIGDAINTRLIKLYEQRHGEAPIPYAWLTGGSLARREQTAHSDQDNCLLLSDDYDEAAHGEYFTAMAKFVCDGLDACGYVYCPGEVMAMTPKWRQPMRVWKKYFDNWVDAPQPKALMHTCIFFDLRRIAGDEALFDELHRHLIDKSRRTTLFHAFMASNALQFEPPLGFFRNFVLVKDGKHDDTLDLKLGGVVPIIDVARVYALANGIEAVNTWERIEAARQIEGVVSKQGAAGLIDALDFISSIRLRHQARQIRNGEKPDNFVSPANLSHLERKHLKDAFSSVRTVQSALSLRYQSGVFG